MKQALNEQTEMQERLDKPLYTPEEMLPAWTLWAGLAIVALLLAIVMVQGLN